MSGKNSPISKGKERKPRNGGQFSHIDAAREILKRNSEKTPMHYEEIAKRALDAGLIVSGAKNPAQSLYAAVRKDVKKGNSRFLIDGSGMVSLVAWQGARLLQSMDEYNAKMKESILSSLKEMSGGQFEKFVADTLLPGMGFEDCVATQLSHDKGIDVRARLAIMDAVYVNVSVQVKGGRQPKAISPDKIQALRGALNHQEQGLFITTGRFSRSAREEAEVSDGTKSHISLIDGKRLVDVLLNLARNGKGGGVRMETREMFFPDKSFFKNYGKAESTEEDE